MKKQDCDKLGYSDAECNELGDRPSFVAYAGSDVDFVCRITYPQCTPYPRAVWQKLDHSGEWEDFYIQPDGEEKESFSTLKFRAIDDLKRSGC